MNILDLTINEFTDGLECVIEYVHWEIDGIKGTTKLKPPKKLFKPLTEVTDAEIISWVYAEDADKIAKFKRNKKLSRKISFGVIPELSEEAEQAKKDYWVAWANARLEKHVLLDGQAEVREMLLTGEQVFNEETGEMEDVLEEVVVKPLIDPVDEFVEMTVYDRDNPDAEPTVEQVRNPLVVKDEEERKKALEILEKYNDR